MVLSYYFSLADYDMGTALELNEVGFFDIFLLKWFWFNAID